MFEMPAEAEAFYDPPFAYSKVLGRNIDHSEWDVAYQQPTLSSCPNQTPAVRLPMMATSLRLWRYA